LLSPTRFDSSASKEDTPAREGGRQVDAKKGISRKRFLAGSLTLAGLGLFSVGQRNNEFANTAQAQAEDATTDSEASATRLILLGTNGGPRPNPTRSLPAQVVLVNEVPYVVDCGSGVARQLVSAEVDLRDLAYVFITHQHSDHNLDYGNLIYEAWVSGLTTGVDAYGPPPLEQMTESYLELNEYDIETRIDDESRVSLEPLIQANEISEGGLVMEDENVKVTSALVEHPPVEPSFAFRFDAADRSIVISGDTNYSESLIELAQGADVLVHEALYEPGVEELVSGVPNAETLYEHIVNSHTTAEDAGTVASEAGVGTLVLSHFVPGAGRGAASDDVWQQEAEKNFDGEVIVGADLMEI
jgi:ribonuclease BN (tRNA processing enzyme)